VRLQLGTGDSALVTRHRGYELVVEEDDLDANVFERLAESGRRSLADADPEAAVALLSEALALWRGPAMADVPPAPAVTTEASRLEQCRLSALETWLGALLDLGRHEDAVDEAYRLANEHPLRERLWAQAMLALYRCGRRAEALDAYQRARSVLVAELGLEPGPELRDLQQAILAEDTRLASPAPIGGTTPVRAVAPAQLPADVASFTGREEHLGHPRRIATGRAGSTSDRGDLHRRGCRRGGQDGAGGALGAPRARPVLGRSAVRQPARLCARAGAAPDRRRGAVPVGVGGSGGAHPGRPGGGRRGVPQHPVR